MAIILVLLVIAAAVGVAYVSINNGIVTKDNRCDNAWQTIDAQLQRRNDLIPNLVETVKGYMQHEADTLQAVTAARAAVAGAGTPEAKMEASGQLTQALGHLFAVAEAYPDLKANTNFSQLQTDLTDTENKISYARMSYNDCVLEYNNAIETFPGNIVAGSRFKPRQGFVVEDASVRQAPTVSF
ncbi:MAG: LemA family protein [Atopobiaceae bacterium]|nr:LemA family protein [Atopobiaceae bacterium]MDO4405045.1 LemA family protein [Atopobiaceae bacterium]